MAPSEKVLIAIIGAGGVGRCFLSQLATLAQRRPKPALSLVYLCTSKKALFNTDYDPLDYATALSQLLASSQTPLPTSDLATFISSAPAPVILVDNTADQTIADAYPTFLERGIHVVTPNKKAFSGSYSLWTSIFSAAARSGAKVYHESSCGAGLPVISTLKDLVETGDEIVRIEGVFSGTMSFLFNSFAPVASSPDPVKRSTWSAEVIRAKSLGYTEPDPREDLNGLDFARKLTILARLAGLQVASPASFPVESLIPPELEFCASADDFLARLPEFDERMDSIKAAAEREGKVVRFVGSVDVPAAKVKVGLETLNKTHAIAALRGSDNIISFYTKRYGNSPLIVQGAGAGGVVTAMGVTADLLKLLGQI